MSLKYIVRPSLTLFITSVLVIAGLSFVYDFTREPIAIQQRRAKDAAMRAVLPQASDFRPAQPQVTSGNIVAIYEAFDSSGLVGYVVQLAPKGYSGPIDLMVGVCVTEKKVTGMRILRHTETPGLGAQAVKEDFYRRFDNRALVPLSVVRSSPGEHDISAITSSTITTRAITGAVNEAIQWYLTTSGQ